MSYYFSAGAGRLQGVVDGALLSFWFPLRGMMKTFLLKKVATEDGSFCSYKFSGYGNVAEAWKEALEIPNVEGKIEELYAELLPFYQLLHGYVRSRMIKSKHPSIPFEAIFPFEDIRLTHSKKKFTCSHRSILPSIPFVLLLLLH